MNLIQNAVNGATESIMNRFLRNAGIENMIEHPTEYKLEVSFTKEGADIKIRKKVGES